MPLISTIFSLLVSFDFPFFDFINCVLCCGQGIAAAVVVLSCQCNKNHQHSNTPPPTQVDIDSLVHVVRNVPVAELTISVLQPIAEKPHTLLSAIGSPSRTYLMRDPATDRLLVLKQIVFSTLEAATHAVEEGSRLTTQLSHPSLLAPLACRLGSVDSDGNSVVEVLMDHCPFGNLDTALGQLGQAGRDRAAKRLLEGLEFLAQKQLIHENLKVCITPGHCICPEQPHHHTHESSFWPRSCFFTEPQSLHHPGALHLSGTDMNRTRAHVHTHHTVLIRARFAIHVIWWIKTCRAPFLKITMLTVVAVSYYYYVFFFCQPTNVLFRAGTDGQPELVLADCGSALHAPSCMPGCGLRTPLGTLAFWPPELHTQHYYQRSDIFVGGLLLFCLFANIAPGQFAGLQRCLAWQMPERELIGVVRGRMKAAGVRTAAIDGVVMMVAHKSALRPMPNVVMARLWPPSPSKTSGSNGGATPRSAAGTSATPTPRSRTTTPSSSPTRTGSPPTRTGIRTAPSPSHEQQQGRRDITPRSQPATPTATARPARGATMMNPPSTAATRTRTAATSTARRTPPRTRAHSASTHQHPPPVGTTPTTLVPLAVPLPTDGMSGGGAPSPSESTVICSTEHITIPLLPLPTALPPAAAAPPRRTAPATARHPGQAARGGGDVRSPPQWLSPRSAGEASPTPSLSPPRGAASSPRGHQQPPMLRGPGLTPEKEAALAFAKEAFAEPDVVDIRHKTLTEANVQALVRSLRTHPAISKVHIEGCRLPGPTIDALAPLFQNSHLSQVSLPNNGLSDSAAAVLVQALMSPSLTLEVLNLEGNAIGDEGALSVATLVQRLPSFKRVCGCLKSRSARPNPSPLSDQNQSTVTDSYTPPSFGHLLCLSGNRVTEGTFMGLVTGPLRGRLDERR
ncbi:hypothetical protein PAPYR_2495 [Paratrimastix pyriformis]|uniref:Protein kinase domain-containing protein n=1 Tax=Paratrimastix pyriformis TaxID=342808 RepID=A0ABQ8UPF7_9EUKA|nr:hypothetical protein PAPYR_2495 [Paratrimastix pyriformis]